MTASKETLELLHKMVGEKLLEKIQSGNATASDFAQAIKFLSDNGIDAAPGDDNTLGKLEAALTSKLPFSDPQDATQH